MNCIINLHVWQSPAFGSPQDSPASGGGLCVCVCVCVYESVRLHKGRHNATNRLPQQFAAANFEGMAVFVSAVMPARQVFGEVQCLVIAVGDVKDGCNRVLTGFHVTSPRATCLYAALTYVRAQVT